MDTDNSVVMAGGGWWLGGGGQREEKWETSVVVSRIKKWQQLTHAHTQLIMPAPSVTHLKRSAQRPHMASPSHHALQLVTQI